MLLEVRIGGGKGVARGSGGRERGDRWGWERDETKGINNDKHKGERIEGNERSTVTVGSD